MHVFFSTIKSHKWPGGFSLHIKYTPENKLNMEKSQNIFYKVNINQTYRKKNKFLNCKKQKYKDIHKYKIKKTFTCCPVKYFRFKKYTRIFILYAWQKKSLGLERASGYNHLQKQIFLKTILVKLYPSKLTYKKDWYLNNQLLLIKNRTLAFLA